jgi:hypothetical protein
MSVINLTPHSVEVYAQSQFINLEQTNPTTWVADGVKGIPLASYDSEGVARIDTKVSHVAASDSCHLPGQIVVTEYGEASGIPEGTTNQDTLIVSLPMKSMAVASGHPLARVMISPYKVVRSRSNGSLVLGCMGFTY